MPQETSQRPAASWLARAVLAFGAIFAALWLVHLPLLRLPYFWDEAGYFIPAARDIFLTGDLIPHTTLSNAHPPLVMLWLALCWKLYGLHAGGDPYGDAAGGGFGFTGLWLLGCRVASRAVAGAAVVLTALSPTVFSQSAMAQLDIAAFALVLWTLYAHICGRRWQAIAFAALAAVAKETTVAVTLTLAGMELLGWIVFRWWPARAAKWCLPRRKLAQCAA